MNLKNTLILLTVVLSGYKASAQCTASFIPYLDTAKMSVYFYNNSSPTSSVSYKWDFGDSSGSTAQHPSHQYKSLGSYNACLMIFDSKTSCRDTVCIQINVKRMSCNANFDYWIKDSFNTFSFNTNGSYGTSYHFDFGDGSYYIGTNTVHQFKRNGTYKVCHEVTNSTSACADTVCKMVVADSTYPCSADFSSVQDTSNYLKVYLSAIDRTADYYIWNYNGINKNSKDTSFTFTSAGWQYLSLQVINLTKHCKDTIGKYVPVTCIPGFDTEINHKTKTVKFTIDSTANSKNMTNFSWLFGDGTSSNAKNPTHTYNSHGSYWVTLYAFDSIKRCGDTTGYMITILGCDTSYSISVSGDSVYFSTSNTSKNVWDMGDGTLYNNFLGGVHVYKNAGTYNVCFKAYCFTTDSFVGCQTITIKKSTCEAKFSTYPDGKVWYKYDFTNLSTMSSTATSFWAFGDGNSSTATSPSHTYANGGPGYHNVRLIINDTQRNCRDTAYTALIFGSKCNSAFSYKMWDSALHHSSTYIPVWGNPSWAKPYWTFGDGDTSTFVDGSHVYAKPGTYQVCLKIKCSATDSSTTCKTVNAYWGNQCKADFTSSPDSANGYKINFSNRSSNSSTMRYLWKFGDGTSSSSTHPSHAYNSLGSYSVCLYISDTATKCNDSICRTITISTQKCNADFVFTSSSMNYLKYDFVSINRSSGIFYQWIFDGVTHSSTADSVSRTFPKPGTYNVCLIISDTANNCRDTVCYNLKIVSQCLSGFSHSMKALDSIVVYSLNSLPTGATVRWDFGDGSSSSTTSGTHTYKKSGSYNMCVTVFCAADTSKTCVTINVSRCNALFAVAIDTAQKFKLFLINKSTNTSSMKYYWDFGDGSSSTSRNPTHKYNSFGKFRVCLTLTDSAINCNSTYCDTLGLDSNGKLLKAGGWDLVVLDESIFGVESVAKSDMKVYPNPANDKITIELSNSRIIYDHMEIIGCNGQVVMSQPVDIGKEKIEVNIQNLSKGLYLIRLKSDGGQIHAKMIKN